MTEVTKKQLLDVARDAIREEIIDKQLVDRDALLKNNVELDVKRPCFVILNRRHNNNLAGCVGSIQPTIGIIDEVIKNAKLAAFEDKRFKPLEKESELEALRIEIALVSPLTEVFFEDRKEIMSKFTKKDGIVLAKDSQLAVFLPDIWQDVKDYNGLIAHITGNADVQNEDFEDCQMFKFQVEKFSD